MAPVDRPTKGAGRVKTHWQVVNRTYPGDGQVLGSHTVTSFEFGNGVNLQYDPRNGSMTIHLPVREAVLSSGRRTEVVSNDQVFVVLDRTEGQLTAINIVKPEES